MSITGSTFLNFYHSGLGAALYSISSDTAITTSHFQSNKANDGAAIYYDCADKTLCIYTISHTRF
jgi:hypothetical protein